MSIGCLVSIDIQNVVHVKKVNTLNLNHEIVLKKRLQNANIDLTDKCIVSEEKRRLIKEVEPLNLEEPLPPWITWREAYGEELRAC